MSTWYSKHVEENIWRTNNIKCITLVFCMINSWCTVRETLSTTLFQHKDIHKITWRSPDVHHFSQIDRLLTDSRHVSHLMDVRSHRYANVDSDHFLIVSRIQARISNAKKFVKNVKSQCGDASAYTATSPHWLFTFLTNFKISDFNKEHTSSLKMIWMMIETCWSVFRCFNMNILLY